MRCHDNRHLMERSAVPPSTIRRRDPLGRFLRLGWFFGWRLIRLHPFGVKNARLVDALVGVRAEEIALRLQQIGRQARLTIAVEISRATR